MSGDPRVEVAAQALAEYIRGPLNTRVTPTDRHVARVVVEALDAADRPSTEGAKR